ncbi:MAG TPA: sigma-70 family RNA polymerase sigma factor [Acidobacteriota bacterium]
MAPYDQNDLVARRLDRGKIRLLQALVRHPRGRAALLELGERYRCRELPWHELLVWAKQPRSNGPQSALRTWLLHEMSRFKRYSREVDKINQEMRRLKASKPAFLQRERRRELCYQKLTGIAWGLKLKVERLQEVVAQLRQEESSTKAAPASPRTDVLLLEMEEGLRRWLEARQELIEANVPLVRSVSNRYRVPFADPSELLQEGTIGLIHAVDHYARRPGNTFATYAVYWIRQALQRHLHQVRSLIKVPAHLLPELLNQDPENDTGLLPRHIFALDEPIGEDGDTLGARLPDDQIPSPFHQAKEQEVRRKVRAAVDQLEAREAEIVRRRFGFSDDVEWTHEAIAGSFGFSKQRAQQLAERSLRKLRGILQ